MPYKDVLVHLDSTPRSEARAEIAVAIAERFGARLKAVFAECDPYLANLASRLPAVMFGEEAARLEPWLRAKAAASGVALEWEATIVRRDGPLTRSVLFGARHSDLVVLGQHDPQQQPTSGVPSDLVEQIVLNAGTPVLVVPFVGDFPTVGERVMVGWNAGRESARAVHDAVPFLETAREVVVIAINPQRTGSQHGTVPCADIARHLEAYGIDADTETLEVDDIGIMDMLLSRVADRGIDLLVMGAHGHYGFPHLHRGGGTRHLLNQLTVPVLMSH